MRRPLEGRTVLLRLESLGDRSLPNDLTQLAGVALGSAMPAMTAVQDIAESSSPTAVRMLLVKNDARTSQRASADAWVLALAANRSGGREPAAGFWETANEVPPTDLRIRQGASSSSPTQKSE